MARLIFEAADVRRVVLHALKCGTTEILLVHDRGVYLMSAGEPRDLIDDTSSFCAYARGCNPNTLPFEQWWENSRALVGGDDFGERLPWADEIKQLLDHGYKRIAIEISAQTLGLVTEEEPR
jgi:hypothetical protein